jgi:hypothetical protein
MVPVSFWCFVLLLLLSKVIALDTTKFHHPKDSNSQESTTTDKVNQIPESSNVPHSRQKRLIWITDDGRLALPPGTSLVIAPTLAMPFVRYPPDGFHSNLSISIPLTSEYMSSENDFRLLFCRFFSIASFFMFYVMSWLI